jgi:hypothetical protein
MRRFASRLGLLAAAGLLLLPACGSPKAGAPTRSDDPDDPPEVDAGAGGSGGSPTGGKGGSPSGGKGGSQAGGSGGSPSGGSGGNGGGMPDAARPSPDVQPEDPADAGAVEAGPMPDPGNTEKDGFGVRKIYPTKAGGREWSLPATAERSDGEWISGSSVTGTGEPGVFHIQGSPRLAVASPVGKPWWRNVELTGYFRLRGNMGGDIAPQYQFYARGERHVTSMIAGASINQSRPAPAGTPAWPGYPFSGMINGHCLGTSYKGYLYISGRMDFKKEISHTAGYTGARDGKQVAGGVPMNAWIGFKVMIRNFNADQAVHMESWVDEKATGDWRKMSEVRDTGGWQGGAGLDGCNAAPFNFKQDQLITWAGPYVNFRFDNLSSDLKWLSAREIAPMP